MHIKANDIYFGDFPPDWARYWCGGIGAEWTLVPAQAACRFCKAGVARAIKARNGWPEPPGEPLDEPPAMVGELAADLDAAIAADADDGYITIAYATGVIHADADGARGHG